MQKFFQLSFLILLIQCGLLVSRDDSSINGVDGSVPVLYNDEGKPLPPVSSSWSDPNTQIFVGISHFRDNRCSITLNNLFSKAKYPVRLNVGIAQQIHTEKDNFDCLRDYCGKFGGGQGNCLHRGQIQQIEFTHQVAKGPQYARYLQQSLRKNEEFCLQTDSHTDFVQDWDVKLTETWGATNNEYAIISTSLPDITKLNDESSNEVPHLCQATIDSREMIVSLPPTTARNLKKPILAPLWSAGFSFSKCHADSKVPNDGNMQMVFDADEFTRYAKFWTRGYDVYTPHMIIAAHDYHNLMQKRAGLDVGDNANPNGPMGWEKNGMSIDWARAMYDQSMDRIATLLGYKDNADKLDIASISTLTKYGLGNKRTLDQLIEFTGIDTRNKVIYDDRCKELHWVPYSYQVNEDANVDNTDIWGKAAEILVQGGSNIPIQSSGTIDLFSEDDYSSGLTKLLLQQQSSSGSDNSNNNLRQEQQQQQQQDDAVRSALGARGESSLKKEFVHRGKELWWIFQSIDTAVETLMNHIDETSGMGHGHKVVKLILLVTPIFILVVFAAIYVLVTGKKSRFGGQDLKSTTNTTQVAD